MKQNTIRPMLFKYWVVCLLLFILFIQARASSFMPAVTNYLAKDYEAGYQNWACAQGSNGEMYFGNSQGLLVYDGYRWTLHKVPGNHIVRSVYVKEDRIYVGAFEEFGYFNGNGKTVFVMAQGLFQTLLVRLPMAYIMSIQPNASLTMIGLAAPTSTAVGVLLNVCFFLYLNRKEKKQG